MMIKIKLTQGQYAIIDNEDFKKIMKYKWYMHKDVHNYYACAIIKRKTTQMHRLIMDCPDNMQIDHINHNGLDNRKCNLRICTHSQNHMNQKTRRDSKTGIKGVYEQKYGYVSKIVVNGKRLNKFFVDIKEAAKWYNKMAKKYYGEYAYLNDV